ncbi:polysaccharide deacetylase family protein [Paenibacillus sp. strain BS8-2]
MMRIDSLQTIELLSLEDRHDRYVMKLGVGLDNGQKGALTELEAELDEATYLQLQQLAPLSDGRVRLSLYTKYDPFRRTYFGSIVKLDKSGGRLYYFDCSAEFETMLARFRNCEWMELTSAETPESAVPSVLVNGSVETTVMWSSVSHVVNAYVRPRMIRYSLSALRLLVLSLVLLLVWFEVEGQIYIDDAKALSENQPVVVEGAGEGAKQAGSLADSAFLTTGAGIATNGGQDLAVVAKADLSVTQPSDHAQQAKAKAEAGAPEQEKQPETGMLKEEETAASFDEEIVELITLDGDTPLYKLPDGYVALTFDDGPSDYTKAIVDLLKERGVAGTFLFIGRNAEHYPEEAAYAAEHGMAVGNHSWDHSKLTKLQVDDISANLEKANQVIAKQSAAPVSVFRPPYGATNDDVEIATAELGMKTLMWNRDPEDWKADTSEDIVAYFKQLSNSGGIYVMHEKKATLDALPEIIDYLLEQKLKFAVFQ